MCGEFTSDRAQMASNAEKFPFDDAIMTFSHTSETGSISASGGESTKEQVCEVYRQISNIKRTKSQKVNVYRIAVVFAQSIEAIC